MAKRVAIYQHKQLKNGMVASVLFSREFQDNKHIHENLTHFWVVAAIVGHSREDNMTFLQVKDGFEEFLNASTGKGCEGMLEIIKMTKAFAEKQMNRLGAVAFNVVGTDYKRDQLYKKAIYRIAAKEKLICLFTIDEDGNKYFLKKR